MNLKAWSRTHWSLTIVSAAAAVGLGFGLTGVGAGLDQLLQRLRWELRSHPASGSVHIVDIDARSLAALDGWPWPRSHHARVIDQLRKVGAATIAFDVDFSARSTAGDDAALVAALARAHGAVVLPTFRQRSGAGQAEWVDSLPFHEAREQSVLAAVSVRPDADGYVRRMPIATVTRGLPRPSLSAMIAQVSGRAGERFSVDFSIDPGSIPHHSFVDVLKGQVPRNVLAGKRVLIGASAIELGDQYAVPRYGVIPGVVIQALAAETLTAGTFRPVAWPLPLLFALLVVAALLRTRTGPRLAVWVGVSLVTMFAGSLAAEQWMHFIVPLAPAFAAIAFAAAAVAALQLAADTERRRLTDVESGLPNKAAMARWLQENSFHSIVVARVAAFERLAAALGGHEIGETIRRLQDRVALAVEGVPIFRIEEGVLAWPEVQGDRASLENRLAGIRTAMLNPIEVRGRRADVTLHFGVAENDGDAPLQLMAHAVLASERARETHRGWRVHDEADRAQLGRELSLLGELDEAVATGGLHVHYQPKLDLGARRIRSAEALIRWRHPELGALSPDAFVPLAERHDRILPLTRFVLDTALRDSAEWRRRGHDMSVAVNVSPLLVVSPDFFEAVAQIVAGPHFVRGSLIFEVTESAVLEDLESAIQALHAFRSMGIAISMDDYGTGQSTLAYLQQLPLDELKIDRRFVQHADKDRNDAVLVQSTIDMAHKLGLKVVAEGVEDKGCFDFLKSAGCDAVQGYFTGKPMSSEMLIREMTSSTRRAA
ncbi:putative bifunctional diguanylate cyclase/phosphodiesterase [Sphingomonas tabacisoli]|uniref:Bifunctional diguanylate cyclase/phosphodiesterase n=1 Tax=Sphingomonas tabacisoli TaxID=2249466 RepID=A0ABW4I452_9SPHN